jgi:hypothetical protein
MVDEGDYIFAIDGGNAFLTPYSESDRYQRIQLSKGEGEVLIAKAFCAGMSEIIGSFPFSLKVVLDELGQADHHWSDC